ncbi:MAG TPA: tetratricopeptide repeat protein [Caulobacteraceae bacterium]|nr:tetratricopeptide repeat protein [Caulobacteraceae bacterium]
MRACLALALAVSVIGPSAAAQIMTPSEAAVRYEEAQHQGDLQARFKERLADAKTAYDHGDFARARELFQDPADQGVPIAQYSLALMSEKGQGGPKDEHAAANWLTKAAGGGFPPAEFSLGAAYLAGRGVPRDDKEAVRWLRAAADAGVPQAQYDLGVLYEAGRGVPKDEKAAAEWYQKAAAGGVK